MGRAKKTYSLFNERAGRVMTLVVGAGAFLLLHQFTVGIVVTRAAQLQVLLLYGVSRHLLNGQPVQGLLSGGSKHTYTHAQINKTLQGSSVTHKKGLQET